MHISDYAIQQHAQALDDEWFWHTRAWNLQEAIESVRRGRSRIALRYILFKWPFKGIKERLNTPVTVGPDLAIMNLRDLLRYQGAPMYVDFEDEKKKEVVLQNRVFGKNLEVINALLTLTYGRGDWHVENEKDSPIWRSLWVRTSSREHDLLYSSMNLFSTPVPLEVDYSVEFESLLVHFVSTLHTKRSIPYWFLIGHRIPVYRWSGLLPKRPNFKMHGVPTYQIGSETVEAQELLCGTGCCANLDLCCEIMGASKVSGHSLCAKFLKVVRVAKAAPNTLTYYSGLHWQHVRKVLVSYNPRGYHGTHDNWSYAVDSQAGITEAHTYNRSKKENEPINRWEIHNNDGVAAEFNKDESWHRSETNGADLTPLSHPSQEHGEVATTGLCWFDGKIGPYLAIIGFRNTHYQSPVVYFFDRTPAGNLQRVGTGKLLFKQRDRIKSDIPWRHLQVGGENSSAVPRFENCDCGNKEEVPKIELIQKRDPYVRQLF